ncbi:MAG: chemotaxis protein, partial [Anaerolineae bacterium]|nr:chemotaxis protein [Anaerolineae bacterium]
MQQIAHGDRLMLAVIWASAAVALGLGLYYGDVLLGIVFGAGLAGAFTVFALAAPGALATRLAAGVTAMAMVGLHIHLARGAAELHFGVFVLSSFLLVSRDWRPIVAAAATIAVHHLSFNYLQAFGWGVFCFTEPGLPRVLAHAGYV